MGNIDINNMPIFGLHSIHIACCFEIHSIHIACCSEIQCSRLRRCMPLVICRFSYSALAVAMLDLILFTLLVHCKIKENMGSEKLFLY